jgi:hypothetical protein
MFRDPRFIFKNTGHFKSYQFLKFSLVLIGVGEGTYVSNFPHS